MKSLAELKAIRDRMQGEVNMREDDNSHHIRVVVGMATCGIASGARPVLNKLAEDVCKGVCNYLGIAEDVQAKHLDNVIVTQTGCIGLCQYEPIVEVYEPGKEKVTYIKMTPEKADEVVEQHLIRGQVLGKYTLSATNL